jgi:magnesium-transporting ATPase (P-type)
MVFDKTGTLTEEDLNVHGFIYVSDKNSFETEMKNISDLNKGGIDEKPK